MEPTLSLALSFVLMLLKPMLSALSAAISSPPSPPVLLLHRRWWGMVILWSFSPPAANAENEVNLAISASDATMAVGSVGSFLDESSPCISRLGSNVGPIRCRVKETFHPPAASE